MRKLSELNTMPEAEFVELLGAIFEHAPWVAQRASEVRPFASIRDLFNTMLKIIRAAPDEMRHSLLASHPELAGQAARQGSIAPDSIAEQAAAGLDRMSDAEYARFEKLNAAYRSKFGLPFILCIKRHGRVSLLQTFEKRLASDLDSERLTAETEVFRIAAIRLNSLVVGEGPLRTTGRISTHVLDSALGGPAAGVALELHEFVSQTRTVLAASMETNAEGRTDAPLIGGRPIPIAIYELRFALGDYHRRLGLALVEPPFLDIIPLRFGVSDPEGHYHVPLVVTAWSFQTYRGS